MEQKRSRTAKAILRKNNNNKARGKTYPPTVLKCKCPYAPLTTKVTEAQRCLAGFPESLS